FQCPFCKRFFDDSLSKIKTEYLNTGKARLVYRDFPLSFHQNAQLSAEASECADEQNNFWGYHDALFNKQSEWSPLSNADATTKFVSYASELGLNSSTFQSCLSSGKYKEEVQKDIEEGSKFGVGGTPTVFINGKRIIGAQPYETFKTEIEAALSNAN
ncbi:DsbA family protein, partial [candidate division WWE3 bacterium]|nr:DsbA family protein [candidate division WWE3 bacterium]